MRGSKEKLIYVEGEIIENLPNTMFKVKINNSEKVILCYLSGKMRRNFIKILPGDKVKVELSPYDQERGRIIYRL